MIAHFFSEGKCPPTLFQGGENVRPSFFRGKCPTPRLREGQISGGKCPGSNVRLPVFGHCGTRYHLTTNRAKIDYQQSYTHSPALHICDYIGYV